MAECLEILRNRTNSFIQECDLHLKKCIQFLGTLTEIQKDSTRTSKEKLQQLKVKFLFLLLLMFNTDDL